MVDRHIHSMACCLQHKRGVASQHDQQSISNEEKDIASPSTIQKHAIIMLSSLLLQDYIKWRGLLFYRFLAATVDEDETVSQLAENTLCGPLLSKQPDLLSSNFVEAIFVLNSCSVHPIYRAAAATGECDNIDIAGFDGIHLFGTKGRKKRLRAYTLCFQI